MNILAVGAHFDDVELGCSGTLINHVRQGNKVTLVVITNSAYKNPNGRLIRSKEDALKEGLTASEIMGAQLICLDYETFMVPFDEKLTKQLTAYIEELEIDTIYSPWTHDLHRDHQYAGKAALMAGRHVPRFLMYRPNFYDTEHAFRGNFYSDISDVFEEKEKVIKAHKSELKRVRYSWLEFIRNQNRNDGQKIGVNYAECFEIARYLI
jgi:LmbE family N-acetylglucosaminyl deacetylase